MAIGIDWKDTQCRVPRVVSPSHTTLYIMFKFGLPIANFPLPSRVASLNNVYYWLSTANTKVFHN